VKLQDLLSLASREGRVCPKPPAWRRLYELLPEKRRDGYGAIPPEPLMFEAWNAASDEQKRERLIEHFAWAENHRALHALHVCLNAMREDEWHHVGD
jgi:hypothetical protein